MAAETLNLDLLLENDTLIKDQQRHVQKFVFYRFERNNRRVFLYFRSPRHAKESGILLDLKNLEDTKLNAYKQIIFYLLQGKFSLLQNQRNVEMVKTLMRAKVISDPFMLGYYNEFSIKIGKQLVLIPVIGNIPVRNLFGVLEIVEGEGLLNP